MLAYLWNDKVEVEVHSVCGSLVAKSRNMNAEYALRGNFTHLLFVDSDQTFPATTANELFSHRLPIVAANIATKSHPPQQTACLRPKLGDPVRLARKLTQSVGIEKAWRVGCGVMLIETEVFRRIEPPYFFNGWDPVEGLVGEDWYFLEKAEAAGIPLYVDHDLSARVTHVGPHHYVLPRYHPQ